MLETSIPLTHSQLIGIMPIFAEQICDMFRILT